MKRREKSLKEEGEDPFPTHFPTAVQQKTLFSGGLSLALRKIQISKGGIEKGWGITHHSRENHMGFSFGMEVGRSARLPALSWGKI